MKHLAWYAHHASVFLETPLSEGALSECINSLAGLGSLACSCVQLKVTDTAKCICHLKKKRKRKKPNTNTPSPPQKKAKKPMSLTRNI